MGAICASRPQAFNVQGGYAKDIQPTPLRSTVSVHCRLPCAVSGSAVLAAAESSGDVVLYSVEKELGGAAVREAQRCAVVKGGLCLSLDWSYCQGQG